MVMPATPETIQQESLRLMLPIPQIIKQELLKHLPQSEDTEYQRTIKSKPSNFFALICYGFKITIEIRREHIVVYRHGIAKELNIKIELEDPTFMHDTVTKIKEIITSTKITWKSDVVIGNLNEQSGFMNE